MPRFLLVFWYALLIGFTYLDVQNQPERHLVNYLLPPISTRI
jgi:hypothetical protein